MIFEKFRVTESILFVYVDKVAVIVMCEIINAVYIIKGELAMCVYIDLYMVDSVRDTSRWIRVFI